LIESEHRTPAQNTAGDGESGEHRAALASALSHSLGGSWHLVLFEAGVF